MFKAAVLTILFATATCLGFVIEAKTYSDSRIVGGNDAIYGQFPWMISFRTRYDDQHQCGGSILNSRWILTAAHCFLLSEAVEDYVIVIGSIFLSSGTAYNVSRFILHEDFDIWTIKNDVAVVELSKEIEFTEFIQPIELGTEFVDEVDSVLSGWGRLYFEGPLPDNLQYMRRRTMTLEDCRRYPTIYPDQLFVSDDEICTMSILDELGFCNGDSGGPLVADGKQIGIVSWGNPPCAFGLPEIYVRVSSYVTWINRAIST